MEEKRVITNKGVLINRECDTAMATKKGYFPCDKKCDRCLACIEVFEGGRREHVTKQQDYRRKYIEKFI